MESKKRIRVNNIPIEDLLMVLVKMSSMYTNVDIILDPENRRVILDPVESVAEINIELTDDNIYDLI